MAFVVEARYIKQNASGFVIISIFLNAGVTSISFNGMGEPGF